MSENSKIERPILFSGAMVRAVIEDRKTKTRRVMKRNTPFERKGEFEWYPGGEKAGFHAGNGPLSQFDVPSGWAAEWCPYGKPGDRLWVRESFAKCTGCNEGNGVIFKAEHDYANGRPSAHGWKPSIHMPRKYSRLTLEIVSIKVERIQDISFEDCLAEGVIWTEFWDKVKGADIAAWARKHPKGISIDESIDRSWKDYTRIAFKGLWDSINEKRGYGWEKNPWVWAIEFKRIQEFPA